MTKVEKTMIGITVLSMIFFIFLVSRSLYETFQESKPPVYEVGECYEIENSGVSVAIKIEVTGFFGIYGRNIQNNLRVYSRFNELKKSNQLDCDLVKKVYE